MIAIWVCMMAVNADHVSVDGGSNDGSERMADPFLKTHVHCLLVPGPVVLDMERIGTKCALKDFIGVRLKRIKFRSWDVAAAAPSLALP